MVTAKNLRLASLLPFVSLAAGLVGADDSPTADGNKHLLRYKFKTGEVTRYQVDHRASVRSTIDDSTQEAQTRTESVKAWKIVDVLPDGEIELIHVVESVRMKNQLPGRAALVFDSQSDATPPPGFEDAAAAVGVPLSRIRISAWGKVLERKVEHSQPAADADAPVTLLLPEEPVAVGATWDEDLDVTVQIQSGGTKAIQARRHYKLAGVSNGIATIEVAYQVLSPINAHIEAQLVQRLMKGTVRFDTRAGRIRAQQMDVDKRILGFAGATSSLHYVMRMQETLVEDVPEVAQKE
jgi:hypothetical protein